MIELAHPWALVLLALPVVVYLFAPTYRERRDAVQVPFFMRLTQWTGLQPEKGAVKLQRNRMQQFFDKFFLLSA